MIDIKQPLSILLFCTTLLGCTGSNFDKNSDKATSKKLLVAQECEYVTIEDIPKLSSCAEQGNAYAQMVLGVHYMKGDGVPLDFEKSARLTRMAADQGNINAQFNLGTLYENGIGVSQSPEQAFYWTNLAANNGYPEAMNNLGKYYRLGFGVQQDNSKAYEWYLKAAQLGVAVAQVNLSRMYYYGLGVKIDRLMAIQLAELGAKSGVLFGMTQLGFYHIETGNFKEGIFWTQKAADLGEPHAQANLAFLYLQGRGVKKDTEKAKQLLISAAEKQSPHV